MTFSLIFIFGLYYLKPKISSQNDNLINGYNASKKDINLEANKNNAESIAKENFVKFDLQEGVKKYKLKDYEGAKEIFLAGAELNNQIALNYLGRLYENGFGIEKNYEQAKSFYERSSRLGNEKAKKNLEHIQSLLVIQEDKLRNVELSQTLKSLAKLDEINTSSKSRADKSQKQEETVPSEYRNLLGHFIIPARFNYAVDNSFILDLLSDGQVIIKANNNFEQFGNIDWGSLEASYPAPDQTYFSYIVYFNSKGNNSKGFKIETKRRNYKNNLIEVETSFHTKLKIFIIFDGPQKYIMRVEEESRRRNGEFSPLFW